MTAPAVPDFTSADGRFVVSYEANAGPRDHLICQPRVTDTRAGAVLLDLWGALTWEWDGSVVDATGGTLVLALRRYPGTVSATLTIDADAGTYRITDVVGRLRLRPLTDRLAAGGLRPA